MTPKPGVFTSPSFASGFLSALVAAHLTACSAGSTLMPVDASSGSGVSSPGAVIAEKSSGSQHENPELRFFCEDGVIHNSLITFSSRAKPEAQASRIFFDDPDRPKALLSGIRHPLVLRTSKTAALVAFEGVSLTGSVGEPLHRAGIYLAELDLVKRTGHAKLLAEAPKPPAEAKRLASVAGIGLRMFGGESSPSTFQDASRGGSTVKLFLPKADGYRLLELSGADLSQAPRELGSVDCPPTQCWNPEFIGEEIWLSSLDFESGRFQIRAFDSALRPLAISRERENAHQLLTARGSADETWIETSDNGAFLGIRGTGNNKDFLVELPASAEPSFPHILRLRHWDADPTTGEALVLPLSQQLWAFSIDRALGRLTPSQQIAMPESTRLVQFLATQSRSLYAVFQTIDGGTNGPRSARKLYGYHAASKSWGALTRDPCVNPTSAKIASEMRGQEQ